MPLDSVIWDPELGKEDPKLGLLRVADAVPNNESETERKFAWNCYGHGDYYSELKYFNWCEIELGPVIAPEITPLSPINDRVAYWILNKYDQCLNSNLDVCVYNDDDNNTWTIIDGVKNTSRTKTKMVTTVDTK